MNDTNNDAASSGAASALAATTRQREQRTLHDHVRSIALAMATMPQHSHLKPKDLAYRAARLALDLERQIDPAIRRVKEEDDRDDDD